jgi:hypothetical protein
MSETISNSASAAASFWADDGPCPPNPKIVIVMGVLKAELFGFGELT